MCCWRSFTRSRGRRRSPGAAGDAEHHDARVHRTELARLDTFLQNRVELGGVAFALIAILAERVGPQLAPLTEVDGQFVEVLGDVGDVGVQGALEAFGRTERAVGGN